MPIISSNHFARARFKQKMAASSATKIERMINAKLADLHSAAGNARPGGAASRDVGR